MPLFRLRGGSDVVSFLGQVQPAVENGPQALGDSSAQQSLVVLSGERRLREVRASALEAAAMSLKRRMCLCLDKSVC